ncbi:MAG TPA: hypothetical protein ENK88_09365 [Campylobacterales bacterium]|nr:hypothetical protein [Campylobacterales bacterium]HHD80640.1 hypothetical protein [Campylobacterales bacterium]
MLNLNTLFELLKTHKWYLIIIITIFTLFTSIYLYLTPYIYKTYTIIEVKDDKSNIGGDDILLSALSGYTSSGVDKDIEILKTFEVNKNIIDKVNLKIQYFIQDKYKDREFYKNSPIRVKNILLYDKQIKEIYIYPQNENEFKIKNEERLFRYNQDIVTKSFEINIKKLSQFDKPIKIKLNLDKRLIYQNIISKNLHIKKVSKNIPLIQISYFDNIPKRAKDYIKNLADSFIANSINSKSEQNSKIIKFIEEELDKTKLKLKKAEKKIEGYQISHKIVNPSMQSNTLIDRLSSIEVKSAENRLKRELINNIYNSTKSGNLNSISPLLQRLGDNSTIRLIDILQDNEIKVNELSYEYTPKHPKMVELYRKISTLKRKIASNIKRLQTSINQENRNIIRIRYKYEKELKALPKKEKKLVNLRRDYEVNSKTYSYLLEKKSENEIIKVAIMSDYKVVDKAYLPRKPVRPKVFTSLIVSFISSTLFAIFIILTKNMFGSKITNIDDIKSKINSKSYTIIPHIKDNQIDEKEFYRVGSRLIDEIELLTQKNSPKVILNLSMSDNEGKTTLAINLGKILHKMDYKTVIIDFDTIKPILHNIFNLNNSIGLGTYLSGGHKIYEIIQNSSYSNLDIITLGLTPPNPTKLIFEDRFSKLLEELRYLRYDYVIVDTSSINLVLKTIYLTKYSDINLAIFRADYSTKESMDRFNSIAEEHKVENITFLLNDFKS